MVERCSICNNTGTVLKSDDLRTEGEVCECRMKEVWTRYMKDLISEVKNMSSYTVGLVNNVISAYKEEEERTGSLKPKHIYIFDEPVDKIKEEDMRFKNIYKSFFLLYLVKSKEFLSYVHYDLQKLIDNYWGVQVAGGSGELEQNFYDYKNKTFLIECKTIIPNKYAFDVVRHLIDFYKDRNIIIYASTKYKEELTVNTKGSDGRYTKQTLDRSLRDILLLEYRDTFVDIKKFINGNPFKA